MVITRQQAETILAVDVEKFANTVRPMIKVTLTDNQFSALVSFAYNVGPAAFARSSVLKAVNARRFDLVSARLALWVKAGGRTLKGLVRRRAAEGQLFARSLLHEPRQQKQKHNVEPASGKPMSKSTTSLAALISGFVGTVSLLAGRMNESFSTFAVAALLAIIITATIWIIRERWKKSVGEGV
jgi:lysozyme